MGNGSASIDPPAVSANGQYEVFTSSATDLVNGVTIQNDSGPGAGIHIYWRNLSNATTALVDVATSGTVSGNHSARDPSITADGRYVAFVGYENNLTNNGASASQPQIYVRDMQAGQTYMVSLGIDGKPENGGPNQTPTPSITEDGNGHLLIAYQSNATNLTANDTSSSQPILSKDGSTLAFLSASSNLAGESGSGTQLFAYKVASGALTQVSPAAGGNVFTALGISDNGQYIAYRYTPGSGEEVLAWNANTGTNTVIDDAAIDPVDPNDLSIHFGDVQISGDGSTVAFQSGKKIYSVNWLAANPTTTLVSDGSTGYHGSSDPSISDNGQVIAFESDASLTANDANANGYLQIFVRNLATNTTTLVSSNSAGTDGGNGDSNTAVVSSDGSTVVYNSQATDLVSGVTVPTVPQLYAFLSNPSAPVIITPPSNQTVTAGQTATFTVTASGSPPPMIQWKASSDGGKTFRNISGATSPTLTLRNVQAFQNGNEYQAVLSNIYGTVPTKAATLTVQTVPAITSGNSAVFTVGKSGSFTVTATGLPTPTLTESGALPRGVTFTDNGNGTATLSGAPTAGAQGTYYFSITAHNGAGSITQRFTLTVKPAPVPPPPVLNVPPLLAFFDSLLGGVETVNANGTETITDRFFGIPLFVSTFDSSGHLVSVDLFGFLNVTFLFLLL